MSKPSSYFIELTWGASGSTIIAPANGWLRLNESHSSTTGAVFLSNLSTGICSSESYYSGPFTANLYVPALKGNNIKLEWNGSLASGAMIGFVYAEGEVYND